MDNSKIINSSSWSLKLAPSIDIRSNYSERLRAKIIKILPQKFLNNYKYFIWIDSNLELKIDPKILINQYLNGYEIALQEHYRRNCIYDEIKEVTSLRLDYYNKLKNQKKDYKKLGYPKNNGLYDCSVIIRKNNRIINNLSETWWEHILKYSSRDQISLPYLLNKKEIEPNIINSEFFIKKGYIVKSFEAPSSRTVKQSHNIFSLKIFIPRQVALCKKYLRNIFKSS